MKIKKTTWFAIIIFFLVGLFCLKTEVFASEYYLYPESSYSYGAILTTTSISITASADDCHDLTNGTFVNAISPAIFGKSGSVFTVGFRFLDVTVPAGVTILSSTITIQASNSDTVGNSIVDIYAWATTTPPGFGNSDGIRPRDINPVTNATVSWTQGGWSANSNYVTPDLSTIIQEIINQPDWESGDDISFVFRPNASTNAYRRAKTYEASTTTAPVLYIYYTTDPLFFVSSTDFIISTGTIGGDGVSDENFVNIVNMSIFQVSVLLFFIIFILLTFFFVYVFRNK